MVPRVRKKHGKVVGPLAPRACEHSSKRHRAIVHADYVKYDMHIYDGYCLIMCTIGERGCIMQYAILVACTLSPKCVICGGMFLIFLETIISKPHECVWFCVLWVVNRNSHNGCIIYMLYYVQSTTYEHTAHMKVLFISECVPFSSKRASCHAITCIICKCLMFTIVCRQPLSHPAPNHPLPQPPSNCNGSDFPAAPTTTTTL